MLRLTFAAYNTFLSVGLNSSKEQNKTTRKKYKMFDMRQLTSTTSLYHHSKVHVVAVNVTAVNYEWPGAQQPSKLLSGRLIQYLPYSIISKSLLLVFAKCQVRISKQRSMASGQHWAPTQPTARGGRLTGNSSTVHVHTRVHADIYIQPFSPTFAKCRPKVPRKS